MLMAPGSEESALTTRDVDVELVVPAKINVIMDTRVRHWLLDAAIYQHSHSFFAPKSRRRLAEEVFRAPGMSELDMLEYMVKRGASRRCIKFALKIYRQANDSVLVKSLSSDTCGELASSDESISENNSSVSTSTSRMHKFIRRLRSIFD